MIELLLSPNKYNGQLQTYYVILEESLAGKKYVIPNHSKQSTADVSTMAPSNSPDEGNHADEQVPISNDDSTNFPYDLTPKHHIRSPIIEETESGVEAELLRSRGNLLSSSFNG